MLKNFLSSTLRQFRKRKWMVLINLTGLSLGLATCLFIFLYLTDELSFEKHYKNSERIYRVNSNIADGDKDDKFALTSFGVGPLLKDQLSSVEEVVRIFPVGQQPVEAENEKFFIEKAFFVDTAFFSLFDLPLVYGNYNALNEPGSILLSKQTAEKFFGAEDPIGKLIKFPKTSYTVKAVYDDTRINTHINGEAYLSVNTLSPEIRTMIHGNDWYKVNTFTYLLLPKNADPAKVEEDMAGVVEEHILPWVRQNELSSVVKFYIEPLTGLRFSEDAQYDPVQKTKTSYLYIFSVAGMLILLLAVFNFINLATAAATLRYKEVAIRKVSGASRRELIFQFLTESAVQVFIALLLALVLVELILPAFNSVTGKEMDFGSILSAAFIGYIFLLFLIVTIAGGAYPALFLSSLQPAALFNQKSTPAAGGVLLRKSLLVLQFAIAVFMLSGTWMVYRQLSFLVNTDTGFKKENILAISLPHSSDSLTVASIQSLRQKLESQSGVLSSSLATHVPGKQVGRLLYFYESKNGQKEVPLSSLFADEDFLNLTEVELVKGRYFDPEIAADKRNFIINEAAVKHFGWEEPLGKKLSMGLGYDGEIVGVVKNFNYQSMHSAIEPLVILVSNQYTPPSYLLVSLDDKGLNGVLPAAESAWKELFSGRPYSYFFIDDNWKEMYRQEQNTLKVFGYFSILSVLISCMGLIGLSIFLVNRRTREIGIRKTLGAGVGDLVLLLNREYIMVVAMAALVALPIAWILVGKWLQTFAFHTSLSVLVFFAVAGVALLIAMITVSVITLRKSKINPVESLRYE